MTDTSKGLKPGPKSKKEIESTKNMSKREQSAALREFRGKLLLNPKSERLIEKLFDLAFDDDAKQQAVALKILSDRIMPVAGFTSDGKSQAQVSINISGIGAPESTGVTIDGTSGGVEGDYHE
jgi:hypothetical protein